MNQLEHKLRLIQTAKQKIPADPYIIEVIDWLTDQIRKYLDQKKILSSALEAIARDKWCSAIKLGDVKDNISIAEIANMALNKCRDE